MASKVVRSGALLAKLLNNSVISHGCCRCFQRLTIHNFQHQLQLVSVPQVSLHVKQFSSDVVHTRSSKPEVEEEDQPDELYKRITIEVKGHDPSVIKSYGKFLSMTTNELGIKVESIKVPKKDIKRYTLLKSVHIYKKHRVQYETRTYFRIMKVIYLTGSTADTFLEYIQRNLPEGMAMKVTKERLETMPNHLKPPEQTLDIGAS